MVQPTTEIFDIVCSAIKTQALHAAVELGLPDLVKDGAVSLGELARVTSANERNLSRLLRALIAMGIFSEPYPGSVGPTPLSACLQSDSPTLYNLARMAGTNWQWRALGELVYSVRTGTPAFEHIFGKEMWRFFKEDDPEAGEIFNRAMTSQAGLVDEHIADAYDFSAMRTIVDVGGGHGGFLMTVLKRNPALKGVLFVAPEVIAQAREQIAEAGLIDRIELVAGDFFQGVPKGGDAYFMRQILLDWEDKECHEILRNCIRAMNPGGTLLVTERIPGPGTTDLVSKLIDVMLMAVLPGRGRDATELRRLIENVGLEVRRIISTGSDYSIIEAR